MDVSGSEALEETGKGNVTLRDCRSFEVEDTESVSSH